MNRQTLLDIVKHSQVGGIETLKVTGSDKETHIEAMDEDRTVILKAELNDVIKDFKGEFGISNLNILKGFLEMPTFKTDGASIEVKREKKKDQECPTEITFTDPKGQSGTFRFMDKSVVPDQAKFKGAKWDVEITPETSKIQEFQQFCNILSSQEENFTPVTRDGNLVFNIGDSQVSQHKSFMIFSEDVTGELKSNIMWPITHTLNILKLEKDPDNIRMKFADVGALQIEISSDYGVYRYTIPGRRP